LFAGGNLSAKPKGIIGSILSPACAAWLRTQVTEVGELQIQIEAGDRQILSGVIPTVSVIAESTVYKGISLQRIQLLAQEIEINLSQVVRGKPLRLLQPLLVAADATIGEPDLLSSLTSPLLAPAVTELLGQLLGSQSDQSLRWQSAQISAGKLLLRGMVDPQGVPITIQTGIQLQAGRIIQLAPLEITCAAFEQRSHDSYTIDLGPEVALDEMTLGDRQLVCRGQVRVHP
jgi:LmeA-like phospholipid-binding